MFLNRIILTLVLLSIPSFIQAQGSLLKKDEHGISLFGSYGRTSEVSSVQATVIGTFAGTIDAGFYVASADRDRPQESVSGTGFLMEIYAVREVPHQRTPFNFSIFGQFGTAENQNFYSFGCSLFKRTDDSKKAFIQPALSVAGTWQQDYNESEVTVVLGISIASKIGEASVLHVTPSFGKAGDGIVIGVDAGIVLGKSTGQKAKAKKEKGKKWDF